MTETFSAYLLVPVAALAISLGNVQSGRFLSSERIILGFHISISEFVLEYLLALFFFKIGLELRYEMLEGVLKDRKFLGVSALSAGLGMVVPVAIFFLISRLINISAQGWGVIMATDLPLVLALVAILKKGKLRPFILALATLDDLGSIVVLSFIQKSNVRWLFVLIFVVLLGIYVQVSKRIQSVSLLLLLFISGIVMGNRAGIPVSLSAVLFGIFTIGNHSFNPMTEQRLLRFLEPISALFVVPTFLFVTLFRKFEITTAVFSGGLLISLVIARLVGKPMGVVLGVLIGKKLFKDRVLITSNEGLLVGLLATLGLSVSLIFAQGQLSGFALNIAILAILFTLPLGILATVLYLRISERFYR